MKQQWCPEVRRAEVRAFFEPIDIHGSKIIAGAHVAENRPKLMGVGSVNIVASPKGEEMMCLCMGRACAHWRWAEAPLSPTKTDEGIEVQPEQSLREGYCGLSGKPEFSE